MTRQRSRQADLKPIYKLHGGELMFWLKWVDGRIDSHVRHELLEAARRDADLHSTIKSLEVPDVRTQVRCALEATNYLTPGSPTRGDEDDSTSMILGQQSPSAPRQELIGGAEELTYGVISQPSPRRAPATASRGSSDRSGVYARVQQALGRLLAEVDIVLPSRGESFEATRLLHHLVGDESVNHFRTLHNWLREARRRRASSNAKSLSALDRLLAWVAPECFATAPRAELSFRLFLRSRFKAYCRAQGWRPSGQKYATLELAFRDLDRSRIGELIRDAMREANADPTSEVARAIAPPAEALLAQAA
jgi:hypothetical protein